MNSETAIMLLEHTGYDDFNLLEHQINSRLEAIQVLIQENKELHNKIDKAIKRIELLGKFDGERCTRNFKMMSADFNYLLEILKNGDVDE